MLAIHRDHTTFAVSCDRRPAGVVYVNDAGEIRLAKYGPDGWARLNIRHDGDPIPSTATGGAWAAYERR